MKAHTPNSAPMHDSWLNPPDDGPWCDTCNQQLVDCTCACDNCDRELHHCICHDGNKVNA